MKDAGVTTPRRQVAMRDRVEWNLEWARDLFAQAADPDSGRADVALALFETACRYLGRAEEAADATDPRIKEAQRWRVESRRAIVARFINKKKGEEG